MDRRTALLGLAALVIPPSATALAQTAGTSATAPPAAGTTPAQPATPAPAQRPRPRRRREQPPPPPPPQQRGDPAPLPDRDLLPPRDRSLDGPRVDADVINPRTPGTGATMEGDQATRERDRLHRPAPGASVRIPF